MPPLPSDRVKHTTSPFGLTGIDYAGPLYVAQFIKCSESVGRTLRVRYYSRSLHLELVDSLSTEVFLLALRRFIARRGKPLRIPFR